MDEEPGLLARIVAHLHGEVAVTALEAFRRGGGSVFDLQPKLLRVLERQEIKRVGADKHHKVDVRIDRRGARILLGCERPDVDGRHERHGNAATVTVTAPHAVTAVRPCAAGWDETSSSRARRAR